MSVAVGHLVPLVPDIELSAQSSMSPAVQNPILDILENIHLLPLLYPLLSAMLFRYA